MVFGDIFVVFDIVTKITSLTVFHDDMQQLFVFFEMVFIYFYKVGMIKLPHDVYFSLSLFSLERIDFDLFVSELLSFLV